MGDLSPTYIKFECVCGGGSGSTPCACLNCTFTNYDHARRAALDLIVAPIFMHIPWVKENIAKEIHVSAQNCSKEKMGAFTGEVSAL